MEAGVDPNEEVDDGVEEDVEHVVALSSKEVKARKKRKRKQKGGKKGEEGTFAGMDFESFMDALHSCESQHNVDGHLKARKDDISEAEIQRLLMLKPSQLTEEERKIRQRAKNRQSAAVAREKRRKK